MGFRTDFTNAEYAAIMDARKAALDAHQDLLVGYDTTPTESEAVELTRTAVDSANHELGGGGGGLTSKSRTSFTSDMFTLIAFGETPTGIEIQGSHGLSLPTFARFTTNNTNTFDLITLGSGGARFLLPGLYVINTAVVVLMNDTPTTVPTINMVVTAGDNTGYLSPQFAPISHTTVFGSLVTYLTSDQITAGALLDVFVSYDGANTGSWTSVMCTIDVDHIAW